MSIVSTTLCYPNPGMPAQGIFVQRRLAAVHELRPLQIVAPVLSFPFLVKPACEARVDFDTTPPAIHPRMFYLPGVAKHLDGRFYARSFRRGLRMLRVLRGWRPSLIDAHFVWPDGVGAYHVAKRLRVPFVCTIRGKLVSQSVEPAKRRQIREMLRGAHALIAVSQSLADLARDVAEQDLPVTVIPNGIDARVFRDLRGDAPAAIVKDLRAKLDWSQAEGVKYVVSVGHMQALKGFDRLVDVWPDVRHRLGDVRLVLVGGSAGEPAYEARLRQQIEAHSSGNAVSCVGRVSTDRIVEMLNAADLFALTSRSEGWCNAIAESLACGCPVVATDVGGNREQLRDDTLGRLVPPNDRAALCDAICAALTAPWDRAQIARRAAERDWQQVARECVDVFDSVLDG